MLAHKNGGGRDVPVDGGNAIGVAVARERRLVFESTSGRVRSEIVVLQILMFVQGVRQDFGCNFSDEISHTIFNGPNGTTCSNRRGPTNCRTKRCHSHIISSSAVYCLFMVLQERESPRRMKLSQKCRGLASKV